MPGPRGIAIVCFLLFTSSAAFSNAYSPLRRTIKRTSPSDAPIDLTGAPDPQGANQLPGPLGWFNWNSIIGVSLVEPSCAAPDEDAPTEADCKTAMKAMETELGSRITAYIATPDSLRILQDLPPIPHIDFLGLPRIYWAGELLWNAAFSS